MTDSAVRTIAPKGSSRLALLSEENAKFACVCGKGGNHFIELNHFLTDITSTCAVSCDFEKSLKPQRRNRFLLRADRRTVRVSSFWWCKRQVVYAGSFTSA